MSLRDELVALSREIHGDPELAYQERRAVERIAALLEKHGHKVERPYGGLETAFRARVGPPGPAVSLLAEYDGLPGVGHGCGHNLISMSVVGAYLLAAERAKKLDVAIELVGTPAEESGGGKIDLLNAGAFRQSVAALFSHPSSDPYWALASPTMGIVVKTVIFHGVAAHAAVSPHLGRNALSAAIRLFVAVDGWRQHLAGDDRVHGIITKGGVASNIIPELAECVFGIRSPRMNELEEMIATFADMCRGAAMQTGTTVEIQDQMRLYAPMEPNPTLTSLLEAEVRARGLELRTGELVPASGDIGNVSQVVPAECLSFPVAEGYVAGHSHAFREAAATDVAQENAWRTAEMLAAAALRLATDATVRSALRP